MQVCVYVCESECFIPIKLNRINTHTCTQKLSLNAITDYDFPNNLMQLEHQERARFTQSAPVPASLLTSTSTSTSVRPWADSAATATATALLKRTISAQHSERRWQRQNCIKNNRKNKKLYINIHTDTHTYAYTQAHVQQ